MKKSRNAYLKVTNKGNNSGGFDFEMAADIEGITRVDRLVLVDQKDGKEWELSVHNGQLVVEPYEKDEKRDFRIKKVID
jgi:hypothetical protein